MQSTATPSRPRDIGTVRMSPRRWLPRWTRPAERQLVPELREGDLIGGRYRVEERLGEGSMGVVVAARSIEQGGRIALKYPQPAGNDPPDLLMRFRWEAQALQRIHSPHVVRTLGSGTLPSGLPYIAMELLDGIDLGQVLAQRAPSLPLPVAEAVDYVAQACEGLMTAHAAGIVHRDVKPANLMLTFRTDRTPLVKVIDFGISRGAGLAHRDADQPVSEVDVLGAPAYMSPEQATSFDDVDARTDIWSLGAVLFRLLTGQHVHEEESTDTLLTKTRTCPAPSVRALRPDLPGALDHLIARCLEREPDRRIQTVTELVRALRAISSS